MPTVCFRGGCLTGPHHAGAELHGFLAYLARAAAEGATYRIFGYKGKQVRDNVHSHDVCTRDRWRSPSDRRRARSTTSAAAARTASRCSRRSPASRSCSARASTTEYVEEARRGDHVCYISDLSRFRSDYPEWDVSVSLEEIFAAARREPPRSATPRPAREGRARRQRRRAEPDRERRRADRVDDAEPPARARRRRDRRSRCATRSTSSRRASRPRRVPSGSARPAPRSCRSCPSSTEFFRGAPAPAARPRAPRAGGRRTRSSSRTSSTRPS